MAGVVYFVSVFRGGLVSDGGSFVAARTFRQRAAAERWLRVEDRAGHVRRCECWRDGEPDGRRYGSVQTFAPGDPIDLRHGWDL